jgi:hypothetical protein
MLQAVQLDFETSAQVAARADQNDYPSYFFMIIVAL